MTHEPHSNRDIRREYWGYDLSQTTKKYCTLHQVPHQEIADTIELAETAGWDLVQILHVDTVYVSILFRRAKKANP